MHDGQPAPSLLDYLAEKIDCTYLSDLRHLDDARRRQLRYQIWQLTPDSATLEEWNDALDYLAGRDAAPDCAAARAALLDALQ